MTEYPEVGFSPLEKVVPPLQGKSSSHCHDVLDPEVHKTCLSGIPLVSDYYRVPGVGMLYYDLKT